MKSLFSPIFLVVISLIIVACQNKPTQTTNSSVQQTLVYARPGDSVGLDVARHDDGESINIAVNFLETLVAFKRGTTTIVPRLATKWEISQDGLTYSFDLRPNVKFHDGTDFNADAVIYAFERQWKKDHPAYSWSAPYNYWGYMAMDDIVKSVKKVNDLKIEIKLKQPNAPFLANLAMAFLSIPSPTAVKKYKKEFDQNPVGTGPYTLASWKKDDAMVLQAFEGYWGENAKIKRVVVRVIPDNQVRLLELKRGNVHIMDYPNPSDIESLKGREDIRVLSQEGLNIGYLTFNMKKKKLQDLRVRKAISFAVDRQRIVDEIFQGFGTIAKHFIPPSMLGYNDRVPHIEYNPEKAKALLKEAGIKTLDLELWAMPVARPYNPNARKMAEFIQADLKRIGINAKIVSYDWGTYLDKTARLEHDIALLGWTGDNGDTDNFLGPFFTIDSAMKVPTQNLSHYLNKQVTEWLQVAARQPLPTRRAQLYGQVLDQLRKDMPLLPIAHSLVMVPIRANIEGYTVHPMGDRWFASVEFKPDS